MASSTAPVWPTDAEYLRGRGPRWCEPRRRCVVNRFKVCAVLVVALAISVPALAGGTASEVTVFYLGRLGDRTNRLGLLAGRLRDLRCRVPRHLPHPRCSGIAGNWYHAGCGIPRGPGRNDRRWSDRSVHLRRGRSADDPVGAGIPDRCARVHGRLRAQRQSRDLAWWRISCPGSMQTTGRWPIANPIYLQGASAGWSTAPPDWRCATRTYFGGLVSRSGPSRRNRSQ